MENSLLYCIWNHQIQRFQLVQNMAGITVVFEKEYDHITVVFYNLHWLPIFNRILYKWLFLVFNNLHDMDYIRLHNTLSYRSYSLCFFTLLILKFIYIYVHYYVFILLLLSCVGCSQYIILLSIIPSSFYANHTI